jgi:beta-1,4-N-acetylglucosaminyltransferase
MEMGNGTQYTTSPRVALVSSCGGHLAELLLLADVFADLPHFFVVDDRIELPHEMREVTHFVTHSERDLKSLVAAFQIAKVFLRERPDVILTTGAGVGLLACLVGRLLGVPTVYIETIARISKPSLTGRIMQYVAHSIFVQWPELVPQLRRAKFAGRVM